jgi:hypothetical protein
MKRGLDIPVVPQRSVIKEEKQQVPSLRSG